MLDLTYLELAGLAADVAIVILLHRWYGSKDKDIQRVLSAPTFSIDQELKSTLVTSVDNTVPYACVYGITEPIGKPLKSHFADVTGVVQHQLVAEHKSKRVQGFWTDVKNVVKDQFNTCPFVLVNADREAGRDVRVELVDVSAADYLRSSLQVTHDKFNPSNDSLLARSFDRLFGDVSKGYQETEKMLAVGVPVLGIGKLVLENGKNITLCPPDESHRYIITTASRTELVRSMKSDARIVKIISRILLVAGGAYCVYFIYRNVRRILNAKRARRLLDDFRLQRRAAAGGADDGAAVEDGHVTCVVCLSQPRDVVLLQCGHICVCSECALALPSPKHCPVCRQQIDRIVPTYIS